MKFFIDSADKNEIQQAFDLGIFDGVTTNPSLISKQGIKGDGLKKYYREICEIAKGGPVSAEVIATDYSTMIKEGEELADIHPNITVKIPMIRDGIKAIEYLSSKNIKTNCTLIFTPIQALLAAKAGATFVSPFLGRLDDISTSGLEMIAQIREIFDNYDFETEILGASVRHPIHVLDCARLGVDVVTMPLKTVDALFKHPLTDSGLEKFLADYAKSNELR